MDTIDGLLRSSKAVKVANALKKAGFDAVSADHGLAIRVSDADGKQLAIVWLPIGEPTPTGLGDMYLWGKTGDENQAEGTTDLDALVERITRSLS